MATRRRSSGFTAPKSEEETASLEEFLDRNAREMFETISQAEAALEVEETPKAVPVAAPLPEITPTDDPGPRFAEPVVAPAPRQPAPQLKAPPQRHPRNVPKFSRFK